MLADLEATEQQRRAELSALAEEKARLDEMVRPRVKPRWVVFAVDSSGSMQGEKMANAKTAVIENARLLLALAGEAVRIGIVRLCGSFHAIHKKVMVRLPARCRAP